MKKLLLLLLALTLAFSFAGCQSRENDTLYVVAPDGATALALSELYAEKPDFGKVQVEYALANGATGITEKILQNAADVAIMPVNLAAKLYAQGVNIRMVSLTNYGLLYMVGINGTVSSMEELVGKVVYNIGRGATPDLTLRYLLNQQGIAYVEDAEGVSADKVTLRYVSQGSELIGMLAQAKAKGNELYGVLGEPAATQATAKTGATTVFNMQEEWMRVTGKKTAFPQACMVMRENVIRERPYFTKTFLEKAAESAEWVKTNAAAAGEAMTAMGTTLNVSVLNENVIARCNIVCVPAKEAKQTVMEYLQILYDFQPALVGNQLPDDAFFA